MIEKVNKSVDVDIKKRLKEIYPEVIEDGKVNIEKLKALLSGETIEKEDDRFYFNWAGKSNIFKIIQAPAYGTLKPIKEKSIDFNNTKNIVIIGENLETLKLLLKHYFNKVQMIYIDPPYNTGKDFIYRDNFKEPLKDYLEKTGQIDGDGEKLTTNTESSGRYHSDWLNFMYPRLFLARSLLKDDGVIFISIDDNEVHHLRMIMDEIFGEENFVEIIMVEMSNTGGMKVGAAKEGKITKNGEYVLVYSRNIREFNQIEKTPLYDFVPGFDTHFNLWKNNDGKIRKFSEVLAENESVIKEFQHYKIEPINNSIPLKKLSDYFDKSEILQKFVLDNLDKITRPRTEVPNIPIQVTRNLRQNEWVEYKSETRNQPYYLTKDDSGNIIQLVPLAYNYRKTDDFEPKYGRSVIRGDFWKGFWLDMGNISKEGGVSFKNGKKPVRLILQLLKWANLNDKTATILDFFAGSGTTGHAVWDLNKEDGGNRKFILVQLNEEVQDEEIKKDFPTVADICIERLRRVSEKYKKGNENSLIQENQDFGFKVFKLDKSNFNLKDEFEFDPSENKEELRKKYLDWLGTWIDEPLVSQYEDIDVIYEVILKEGLNLNSKIEKIRIKDNEFYYIKDEEQNLDFYISLENKFSNETIEEIRTQKFKGKTFVFLDKALTDSDKINLNAFVRLKVI